MGDGWEGLGGRTVDTASRRQRAGGIMHRPSPSYITVQTNLEERHAIKSPAGSVETTCPYLDLLFLYFSAGKGHAAESSLCVLEDVEDAVGS